MKHHTRKRLLSLLMALAMVLALAPTALLDDETQDTIALSLTQGYVGINPAEGLTMAQEGRAPDIRVTITTEGATGGTDPHANDHVKWSSSDPDTVEPHILRDATGAREETGRTFYVQGKKPGIATITGETTDAQGRPTGGTISFDVTVSGIVPNSSTITILENETKMLVVSRPDENPKDPLGIVYYGHAENLLTSISSDRRNILLATGTGVTPDKLAIDGISAGTAIVTITAGIYSAQITVEVEAPNVEPIRGDASPTEPLKFSTIESQIAAMCQEMISAEGDKSLVSITGLNVPTSQGVVYLGYKSPEDTGAGAGSSLTYYANNQPRGPYIKDLVFVPNASYTGEKATITFTGRAANNRTFKGTIEVTLADTHTDVTLTAQNGQPLKLSAAPFSKVCQQEVGAPLSYVIFTLPPAGEGALYRNYVNDLDYASKVSATERYNQSALGELTFVPAQGFVGNVTIGYAGYSTTGKRYDGQLVIKVTRPLDESISYQDYGAGEIPFSGADFEDYSLNMTGAKLGTVSFTPPPASQGRLYRSWRNGRGTEVTGGDEFSLRQLDSVTFVAAEGFNGIVRIPFAGEDRNGVPFDGTVELHIQSAQSNEGDIHYTCAPGQSVKLNVTDFNNLSMTLTGARLHYVTFNTLPDFNQGALYHNRTSAGVIGTRVTTSTRYFNSAIPYLSNLSFWATSSFSSVEIPFTGSNVNGMTFTGLLTISSGAGAGAGGAGVVPYSTVGQSLVTFRAEDFDRVCRQVTNSALNYVSFGLPYSGQGILYYNYRSDTSPTALNAGTSLYCTGDANISKVSFQPAQGYSGVAAVPFTGYAIDGRSFAGTVEITVRGAAALGGAVRYSTGGEPVHFNVYDVGAASGVQPVSLRLTGLPEAGQGKLYYQYTSPTQYSWQGNTSTVYSMGGDPSVSNLTFIPKAGYQGTVTIPYLASNLDGSQSTGSFQITVAQPEQSARFDDLGGASAQTRSAVDFLASLEVVGGTAPRQYEPGASILRADFCVMLSRAFKFNVGGSTQGFSDVPGDAYYAQAVNDLYTLGIVGGVGGGRFDPNASLSRQDAALMVQRTLRIAGMTANDGNAAALASYRDRGQVSDYARGAVSGLVQMGLLPTSNGRLSPRADLTRGDMAILLHRAMTQ